MADAYGKLAAILRADLFLIPLDGKGWFRYHHLFQELLQHRLQAQTLAPIVAELHRRVAAWLAGVGEAHSAIRHLLAAGATDQAAALVETGVAHHAAARSLPGTESPGTAAFRRGHAASTTDA